MKRLLSTFLLLSGLSALSPAYAATQNLNSYYPAPQGDYKDIVVNDIFTFSVPGAACVPNGNNVYLSNYNPATLGAGQLYICDSTGAFTINKDSLWTGNGTYMYPTVSAQKVTIGSAAASVATLDVAGYMHLAGNTAAVYNLAQGAYLNWNDATGGTGEMDFVNNQGGGTGGFQFFNYPNPGVGAGKAVVSISGTGNVVIGTTTTNAHTFNGTTTVTGQGNTNPDLVVNGRLQTGDAGNNGAVIVNAANSLWVGQNGGNNDVGFWTAGNGWSLLVAQNGNVGVGLNDTAPGALLDITATDAVTFGSQADTAPSLIVCTTSAKTSCGHLALTQDTDNNFYAVYAP